MNAHLFVIHFPVVLVVVATVFDLVGVGLKDWALRDWAWRFFLVSAIAVFLAFATGDSALMGALSSATVNTPRLDAHMQWGSVGIWAIIGGALLRTLWRNRFTGVYGWLNLIVLLAAMGLLVAITYTGTLVRHGG